MNAITGQPQGSVADILQEFEAMREVGIFIPANAEKYVRDRPDEIEEYRLSMKISEIADLIINLSA